MANAPDPTSTQIGVNTSITQSGAAFSIALNITTAMPVPNHNFDITLTPSGVVDSRYPNGVIPPLTPSLTWAPIPGVANQPQGTPTSIALSSFLTAVGGTPVYSIVGILPPGWSLNTSTGLLSYSGTGLGSQTVQARAAIGAVLATSLSFPLQTFNPVSPDTTAPTIPTGITLLSSTDNVLSFDAASDPVVAGQSQAGMKQYVITRDANASFGTVGSGIGLTSVYTYNDVGAVGAAGSAIQAANGVDWSISAAGTDIFTSPDAFGFLSRSADGSARGVDTQIVRVNGFTGTVAFAKCGVMYRASLAVDAPFVLLTFQNTGFGINLISRTTTGGAASQTGFAAPAFPIWLKLFWTLATNTFVAGYSVDGKAWQAVGSVVVPLPPVILSGLAVCSHSSGNLATASFAQLNGQNLPVVSFTDPGAGGSAHTYSVVSEDDAGPFNVSASSASVSNSPTPPPSGFGVRVAAAGKFASTADASAYLPQGSACIGPEEAARINDGTGGSMKGWSLVTPAEFTAAIAYGVNTLAAAGKSYGQLNMVRLPINSARYMGFTGRDPYGNFGTNTYWTAGTDSAGNKLYSGGPGGGPGSGIGHETPGDPSVYRANVATFIANANAAGLVVIADLHWGCPTLTSTNQYVLPPGQMAMPGPGDVLCLAQFAADHGSNPGVVIELYNEPYGTNHNDLTTEAKYLGSFSPGQFAFPTAATSPLGLSGGYLGINNIGGSSTTSPILGGNQTCYACGYQQMINAIRATGATCMLAAGSMNYDENPQSWSQAGGVMTLTDPLNNLCVAYHAYSSTPDSVFNTLQAAGLPILCTEMGDLTPSGGYSRWRAAGRGWCWWTWGNYETSPNRQTDPYPVGIMTTGAFSNTVGGVAWQRNGSPAPTGSN